METCDNGTDFEAQRAKKIAENKRRMLELGLLSLAADLKPAKREKCTPKTPTQMPETQQPARQSARNAGKERPSYRDEFDLGSLRAGPARKAPAQRDLRAFWAAYHDVDPETAIAAGSQAVALALIAGTVLNDMPTILYTPVAQTAGRRVVLNVFRHLKWLTEDKTVADQLLFGLILPIYSVIHRGAVE
ncbi:hypothetical protein CYMTET_11300 [Cymbomonas tetramitiformis]|uniref:Uncharacterized protein n=1 Tax=Cymbomonas tetramitiformis TaxID=36881 RepID=A0AAE0GN07_9CHLO|nr:hypothetical protein CYMTET_11300 [Cymbomonas tetramitiformis]